VAESAQILTHAGNVTDTLASVVDLAVTTIDRCDVAGIVLLDGGVLSTRYTPTPVPRPGRTDHSDPAGDVPLFRAVQNGCKLSLLTFS